MNKRLTDISLNEIDTKKAMMDKSEKTYLLVDHTKFEVAGPFFLGNFNEIDCIVTDKFDYTPEVSETLRTITKNMVSGSSLRKGGCTIEYFSF